MVFSVSTFAMESRLAPAILRGRPGARQRRPAARWPASTLARAVQRNLQTIQAVFASQQQAGDVLRGHQAAVCSAATAALRAAAALAAALALHLGVALPPPPAHASAAEDVLLQLVRQVEAKLDGAVEAVKALPVRRCTGGFESVRWMPSACMATPASSGRRLACTSERHQGRLLTCCAHSPLRGRRLLQGGAADPNDAAAARALVEEVCEVVEANFTDTRSSGGFDRTTWLELKQRVVERPLRDRAAAHGCGTLQGGCAAGAPAGAAILPRASVPACNPPTPLAAAIVLRCRAIRELLAALRDPYTRFVPPSEFGEWTVGGWLAAGPPPHSPPAIGDVCPTPNRWRPHLTSPAPCQARCSSTM